MRSTCPTLMSASGSLMASGIRPTTAITIHPSCNSPRNELSTRVMSRKALYMPVTMPTYMTESPWQQHMSRSQQRRNGGGMRPSGSHLACSRTKWVASQAAWTCDNNCLQLGCDDVSKLATCLAKFLAALGFQHADCTLAQMGGERSQAAASGS